MKQFFNKHKNESAYYFTAFVFFSFKRISCMIVKDDSNLYRRIHSMRKVVFLFMLTFIFIIVSACQESTENEANEEQTVTPVEVSEVKTGDLVVHKTVTGQVFPTKQVPVMLEQPAEVHEVHVENGDEVDQDEKILTVKTAMGNVNVNAPIQGVVAQLDVKEDDVVSNEEPIAFVIDTEKVEVMAQITPLTRELIEVDKKYDVVIQDETYRGEVTSLDTMPNEAGQFIAKLEVDNEDDSIMPGEIAKISIPEKRVKKTLIVPTEAIVTDSDEAYIFVVDGDVAKKVVVEVIETQTEETAIDGEVDEGVDVIVNGQFTLTDGSEIEVIKDGNES